MFCGMGSLHLCCPQGQYGRGQDSPLRSCISCEWLKACVLPLFSLPRFSLECCAVEAFVSFRSHLNNAVCKMKIITDYCSEPTAHSRDRSHLDHRFSQKLLCCNLRDVSKQMLSLSRQAYLQSPQTS